MTVGGSGGPTAPVPTTPADPTATQPTPGPNTDSVLSQSLSEISPTSSLYVVPPNTSTASLAPPPAVGGWTPQGQLADAEPISVGLNPDKSVTATWPKGAPALHALTIKLKAMRSGDKIVINLYIENESGKEVSMSEGLFTDGTVTDAHGTALDTEDFDSQWTLDDSGGDGDIHAGQPLVGDFVVDAPTSGSTLNAFWTDAVSVDGEMKGIILIRDIPII